LPNKGSTTVEEWFVLRFSSVQWMTRKTTNTTRIKASFRDCVTRVKSHMSHLMAVFGAGM